MPKEHKTIFGTTEKSNFILNMSYDATYKICRIFLILCMALLALGGAIWLFMGRYYAYIGLGFLTFSGFFTALWFGITLWKTKTTFKNKAYYIAIALTVLTILSTIDSWDRETSFFGNPGRFEGLLALVSYYALFLIATLVCNVKGARAVFDGIVAFGVLNAVVALLQRCGVLFTPFENLNTSTEIGVFLPSGLVGSPIFLATLIVIIMAIAVVGACFDAYVKRRVFYGASILVLTAAAVCTDSLIVVIGLPLVFISVFVFSLIYSKKNHLKLPKNILEHPAGTAAVLLVMFLATAAVIGFAGNFKINDRIIAWEDSFFYIFVSGTLGVSYEGGLYETGMTQALDILKDFSADTHYWLFGTGPDYFWFPVALKNGVPSIAGIANTLDKAYNDYLYTAATRGIPVLLLQLWLLVLSLKNAFKRLKAEISSADSWYIAAAIIAVIAYSVVIFFGVSTIYVAPFFWILLGVLNAKEAAVQTVSAKAAKNAAKLKKKK